jgi:hypothetical protein
MPRTTLHADRERGGVTEEQRFDRFRLEHPALHRMVTAATAATAALAARDGEMFEEILRVRRRAAAEGCRVLCWMDPAGRA